MKSSLSPARQRFLRLLGDIQFGRIENLVLNGGEPLLEVRPRVVRTITFYDNSRATRERDESDFVLKGQVVAMFREFDELGTGVVSRIDIKSGLPCFMTIEEPGCCDRSLATPGLSDRRGVR